ncbi:hypothetical protein SUDANB120_00209 [Streptomyces sp. enrichment culture]|uniref:hypothetical protein n=1 Tax=Streptomyces sp. enrichment culture TaxID=1795815 RepID=UPI003F57B640
MTSPEARGPKLPPTHPPKTPPPQKKPVEAPRPQPAAKPKEVAVPVRPRMVVRNRRTAALAFRADRWAAGKAARQVVEAVRGWGYAGACEGDVEQVVRALVGAAVADGGKRLSVHLGDQEGKILVAVLGHVPGAPDDGVLAQVAALAATCAVGTDTGEDGRRLWAVLDTAPRRRRPAPGPSA